MNSTCHVAILQKKSGLVCQTAVLSLKMLCLNVVMDGNGEKTKPSKKPPKNQWNSLWEQLEFVSFTLLPQEQGRLITKPHLVPLAPDVSVSVYQALTSQLLYWYLLPKASTTGQENSQKIQFSFLFKVAMQLL